VAGDDAYTTALPSYQYVALGARNSHDGVGGGVLVIDLNSTGTTTTNTLC
jgi:hypothetical protein